MNIIDRFLDRLIDLIDDPFKIKERRHKEESQVWINSLTEYYDNHKPSKVGEILEIMDNAPKYPEFKYSKHTEITFYIVCYLLLVGVILGTVYTIKWAVS